MNDKPDKPLNQSKEKPISFASMNLKRQLRFYLSQHGMTAAQLAKKAGVPKQSLSGWLGGSIPRDVRQIKKIADVFCVSIDNLLFGDGRDINHLRNTELDALFGDGWIGGFYEIRLRKIKITKESI